MKRRICLYGNSIILGTLGAGMRRHPNFDVITLAAPLPAARELEALKPEAILFDLEMAHTEAVFSLLEKHPGLLLIGISPDTNLVKVWSGQQLRDLSMRGLVEMIKEQIKKEETDIND